MHRDSHCSRRRLATRNRRRSGSERALPSQARTLEVDALSCRSTRQRRETTPRREGLTTTSRGHPSAPRMRTRAKAREPGEALRSSRCFGAAQNIRSSRAAEHRTPPNRRLRLYRPARRGCRPVVAKLLGTDFAAPAVPGSPRPRPRGAAGGPAGSSVRGGRGAGCRPSLLDNIVAHATICIGSSIGNPTQPRRARRHPSRWNDGAKRTEAPPTRPGAPQFACGPPGPPPAGWAERLAAGRSVVLRRDRRSDLRRPACG